MALTTPDHRITPTTKEHDMTAATRTVYCPTCRQPLTGNWTVVRCYCTEWTPRSRDGIGQYAGLGDLIGSSEVVRFDGDHLVADAYAVAKAGA